MIAPSARPAALALLAILAPALPAALAAADDRTSPRTAVAAAEAGDSAPVTAPTAVEAASAPTAVARAEAESPRLGGPAAFEILKRLAGEWNGTMMTADGPKATVRYRVTAAGSAIMEELGPGSEHEMLSVYFLDGDDLVLSHYCAAGNQPRLVLNPTRSTPEDLRFDFAGGSNIDPAVDMHIHAGRILVAPDGALRTEWTAWAGGKEAEKMVFLLARKKNP